MDFSIILNSRGRPGTLFGLLESIFFRAEDSASTQVLIRVDNDDIRTLQTIPLIKSSFDNVIIEGGERPNNLHDSINDLAQKASGKYVFVVNDDVVFLTDDWDVKISKKIEEKLEQYEDRILYVGVSDTSVDKANHQKYASFPILTKEAVDSLGYFMSNYFVGLGGDVHLYRVFEKIERILLIEDVKLDHLFHSTIEKIINPDQTAFEMRQNTHAHPIDPWTIDISKEVDSLNEQITSRL